jgi:hypothetical protein
MLKEKYFAVRIGNPKTHAPYFMLREGTRTPKLFHDIRDAQDATDSQPERYAVEVEVREVKST